MVAQLTVKPSTSSIRRPNEATREVVFDVSDLAVYYGDFRAVRDVTLPIRENEITALIGPSGCGKTTVLRCLNRMNDLIEAPGSRARSCTTASTCTTSGVDPVEVRRRIGMVFQKPNPFPKSIYDNIAFGPKIAGFKGDMDELVERVASAGRAVGRGEGQAEGVGHGALGRPAAAAVHRPRDRRPSPT